VRAFNTIGASDYSEAGSIALIPPVTPDSLAGTVVAAHLINLSWYESDTIMQGFDVERAPDTAGTPGAWAQLADYPALPPMVITATQRWS
jgi:hypothetical protein